MARVFPGQAPGPSSNKMESGPKESKKPRKRRVAVETSGNAQEVDNGSQE